MNGTQPKLISFDAGGTLLHPYPSVGAVYQSVLRKHDLDHPVDALNSNFGRAFRQISKDMTILDGEARERSFWQSVVRESIRPFEKQPKDFALLFQDIWIAFSHGDCWRVCPGVHETLDTLKSNGYSLAVLTNWDSRVHRVLKETKLDSYFDHVFVSSEIGVEKPDAAVFKYVENASGHSGSEILHIGDSIKHDIDGATAIGWNALLISYDPSVEAAVPVVTEFKQILDKLEIDDSIRPIVEA